MINVDSFSWKFLFNCVMKWFIWQWRGYPKRRKIRTNQFNFNPVASVCDLTIHLDSYHLRPYRRDEFSFSLLQRTSGPQTLNTCKTHMKLVINAWLICLNSFHKLIKWKMISTCAKFKNKMFLTGVYLERFSIDE